MKPTNIDCEPEFTRKPCHFCLNKNKIYILNEKTQSLRNFDCELKN